MDELGLRLIEADGDKLTLAELLRETELLGLGLLLIERLGLLLIEALGLGDNDGLALGLRLIEAL